jgi:hypothetical protein
MPGTMDRRKFLRVTVGSAAISVFAAYIASQAAPLTMRFAHFAAEDHPANIAAKQFASNVEKRTCQIISSAEVLSSTEQGDFRNTGRGMCLP